MEADAPTTTPTPVEVAMIAATLADRGKFLKDRGYTGAPTYGERYIESARYLLHLAARNERS